MRLLPLALAALVVVAAAAANPPRVGILVPGRSLGGVRLGASPARVTRAWGRRNGVCRGCRVRTWYFNYRLFRPQGAGVEFRRGRVSALFTLWSPHGWRSSDGIAIGDPISRVTGRYDGLAETRCRGYAAYALSGPRATTWFYGARGLVYGFGLSRAGTRACR